MQKKSENKSLFLYAALIFIVAILMILLSVFGQNNMQKQQPPIPENIAIEGTGITENVAKLSEENRLLLEQVHDLSARTALLEQEQLHFNTLLCAASLIEQDDREKAAEVLSVIVVEELNSTQKIFYDLLLTKTKE